MKEKLKNKRGGTIAIFLFALVTGALFAMNANALDVNVVGSSGSGVNGFRWLLEEDNTNITVPGESVRVSISTDIHNSHAPVVATGNEARSRRRAGQRTDQRQNARTAEIS